MREVQAQYLEVGNEIQVLGVLCEVKQVMHFYKRTQLVLSDPDLNDFSIVARKDRIFETV